MAQYQHIDLNTLQEVERLLTSTDFASAEDLVNAGVRGQHLSIASTNGVTTDGFVPSEGLAPLPKRG